MCITSNLCHLIGWLRQTFSMTINYYQEKEMKLKNSGFFLYLLSIFFRWIKRMNSSIYSTLLEFPSLSTFWMIFIATRIAGQAEIQIVPQNHRNLTKNNPFDFADSCKYAMIFEWNISAEINNISPFYEWAYVIKFQRNTMNVVFFVNGIIWWWESFG